MVFANKVKVLFWEIATFRPKDWKCFALQFTADGFWRSLIIRPMNGTAQLLQYPY